MARTRPPKKQTQATEQQGRPKDNEFRAQPVNENVARRAPTNVHGFPTSKEYVFIQKKFDELLSKKFNFFEKHGGRLGKEGTHYFNDGCRRSTFNPQILNFAEYYSDVEQLIEFANITHRDVSLNYNFYKDTRNADITILPLIALLSPSDNHQIILHSKLELPTSEQIKDVKKFVYECCYINKIWLLSSESIRETIYKFFVQTFTTEADSLKKILSKENTFVLMIINRTLKSSNQIEVEHIIVAVIFSANEADAICIDFVSTGIGYHGYGYGTLILHMAQVFGMEYNLNCHKLPSSKTRDTQTQTTYLACQNPMLDYYRKLGFEEVSTDSFISNKEMDDFSDRMNIKEWNKDSPEIQLKLLRIIGKVPREINFVNVVKDVDIEHSLYNKDLFPQFKTLKVGKELKKTMRESMELCVNKLRNHTGSESDVILMNSSSNFLDFLNSKFNDLMFFKIGKWFNSSFEEQMDNFDLKDFMESQTMLIALENLEMQFYQNQYQNIDIDTTEQWACIRCALCSKKVFVKKTKNEKMVEFLLKSVFSVWYSHVFCYEPNRENPFDEMNAGWNLCNQRYGEYLFRLRNSVRFDIDKILPGENGVKKIYVWKKRLQYFFVGFKVNYIKLLEEFVRNMSKFKSLHQKDETSKERRKRKSLLNNYTDELVIGKDETSSRHNQAHSQTANKKHHRELKQRRHVDESTWNEVFYQDLDLQKRIDKLEYVDVDKTEKFYQESLDYLEERDGLKDKNYINEWGEIQNENHYIAHLDDGKIIVLEEEWFKQYDDSDNFSHYVITSGTYRKLGQRSNRPVNLNKQDKNRIRKHVEECKGMCEIQRIKKIKRDKNDTVGYEYINYKVNAENESAPEHSKKVTHSCVSRLDYAGLDRNGRLHLLSNDWIELNFKKRDPKLYKRICTANVGQFVDIPPGNSNQQKLVRKINKNDYGPKNKYTQGSDPSCLFSSLANAIDYLGNPKISFKLIEIYYNEFHNNKNPHVTMKDVLRATTRNHYHKKFESKFKFKVTKVKRPNALDFIHPNKMPENIIYHCVLTNHHSIAICNGLIFDPSLSHSFLLNETNLRSCAEVNEHEKTSEIIVQLYKYS